MDEKTRAGLSCSAQDGRNQLHHFPSSSLGQKRKGAQRHSKDQQTISEFKRLREGKKKITASPGSPEGTKGKRESNVSRSMRVIIPAAFSKIE